MTHRHPPGRDRPHLRAAVALAMAGAAGLTVSGAVHADATAPSLSATVGYAGAGVPPGSWVPATITVRGGGADLNGGSVLVSTGDASSAGGNGCVSQVVSGGVSTTCSGSGSGFGPCVPSCGDTAQTMTYRIPVDLAAGQQRRLGLRIMATQQPLHIELRDASNQLMAYQDVSYSTSSVGDAIVAVVDDGRGRLDGISGAYGVGGGSTAVASLEMTPATLPDDAVLLRTFTEVVIDGTATGSLTSAQRQALVDFVDGGGGLVITTGGAARQTLEGLPAELLPGTVNAPSAMPLPAVLATLGGAQPPATAVEIAALTPAAGASVALSAPGPGPLAIVATRGAGRVLLTGFDPGVDPLAGWSGQKPLLHQLVGLGAPDRLATLAPPLSSTVPGGFPGKGGFGISGFSDSQLASVLTNVPGIELPGSVVVLLLFLGYVLLAGPVSFMALTRLHRRDLLWFTAPGLGVLCAILAYATGFGARSTASVVSEVRVLELGGGSRSLVSSYGAVYSPRGGSATVLLDGRPAISGFAALGSTGGVVAMSGTPEQIQLSDAPASAIRGYSASWYAQTPGSGVVVELQPAANSRLKGRVTNRLGVALTQVVLIDADGTTHNLADIAAGTGVAIDAGAIAGSGSNGPPPGLSNGGPCYGFSPGCGTSSSGDRDTQRRTALSSALQMRAFTDHAGSPVLVAVAASPLWGADVHGNSGNAQVIDGVVIPLARTGPAINGQALRVRAARVDGSSNSNGVGETLDPNGTAILDVSLPAGVTSVRIRPGQVACQICAATGPPSSSNTANGFSVGYDYLDPRTGNWLPLGLPAVTTAQSSSSVDVSALQGADLVLRVRNLGASIDLTAPEVIAGALP